MKKIAIIAPCILPVPATKGGAVEGLITRLIDDNELHKCYEIDLFTLSDDSIDKDYLQTTIIPIRPGRLYQLSNRLSDKYYRTVKNKSAKRSIDRKIKDAFIRRVNETDCRYDAVIIQNMMSTAVTLVRYCNGKYDFPFFFHMHNDVDIYRSPEYIQELVRNGVQFIAVSDYIKKQILRYADDATVHLLYNGIDLAAYHSSKESNRGESFLYAGRIIPDKGVKELVTAFNMLTAGPEVADKKRLSLDITGFSGFDRRYEETVRSLAAANPQIHLHPQIPQNEMAKRYDAADVVMIPSKFEEPFGLVALESMAMGKVIIATNSGALCEVLGEAALIVEKDKDYAGNLCEAIRRVSVDQNLRNKLSHSAYDRVRQIKDFDISAYYPNFCRIITGREANEKISVIVPVYNVEAYLSACMESLIGQSYKNLEIILVNDGSTDSSDEICREYAGRDDRIRIITQDNQGLSAARNTGLDHATGDYVFFCDSDDSLSNDALEKLINKAADDNSDIVACGIANVWYDDCGDVVRSEAFTNSDPGMWSGRQAVVEMMRSNNVCTVAWNKLYRMRLFDDLRFPVGLLHEDEAFTYKLLYGAGLVSYLPDLLYNYRQRSGSIMQADLSGRYAYLIQALIGRREFFEQKGENELAQHSQISLLEQIKYAYRNVCGAEDRKELNGIYARELENGGAPDVMGSQKRLALLCWRYFKY